MGAPSEERAMLMSYDWFVIGNARMISKEYGEDFEEIKERIKAKYKPEDFRPKNVIMSKEDVRDLLVSGGKE